ncbi:aromatic ring-hydroxylating oxygenase subunit alpha [Azospirillum rugosum]|uniref:Rieske 2Fe-2S family protein n=1 Tax=Azospirillum rugosum TaxID=416170 RepID=A0ABS4SUJ4_9PROT|nr:aromatic ring-hydroxylating dioxygenase subunit alpha [Azospirillum rugosum]MBP2295763.1 Rieske 2Fe-2S family protein [Azospirillum rugosum]MDQ0529126.1 Rieske 2Fe-2S family protein [Azospirillum rugosum]
MSDTSDTMFRKTFLDVKQASHAPGLLYNDPEVLQQEIEQIFKRDWLYLARAEELPNPGDYKTFRIANEPIILCRDEAGAIRAYANMCLHRGVEIATGEGNATEFTCPYHGWLYNLDGQLMGASYMRDSEGFDRKACRLPELHVGQWGGFIFVTLAKDPVPFATFIKDFDEKFGYLNLETLKIGLRVDSELQCNWKLMVENFVDFYHVGVLHKDSIGRFMKSVDLTYDLRPNGQVFVDEYDAGTLSKTGDLTAKRIAALEGKSPRFSSAGLLTPNLNFFVRPDYVSVYTSWPLGVDRMRMTGTILWSAETIDGPAREPVVSEFKVMLDKVLGEDFAMVESLQNVTRASRFVPGRMSRLEKGVQHFIKHSVERLYGPQAAEAESADRVADPVK